MYPEEAGDYRAAVTSIGNDVITAASIAADVTTELQSGLATAASLSTVAGYLDTEVAAILAAVDTEVAAIKAVTDNLPNSGALSDLATAAALATVDGIVDAIVIDTQDIQSRIPAALTADGNIKADVKAINAIAVDGAGTSGDPWGPVP
jgi:hypothetical protein